MASSMKDNNSLEGMTCPASWRGVDFIQALRPARRRPLTAALAARRDAPDDVRDRPRRHPVAELKLEAYLPADAAMAPLLDGCRASRRESARRRGPHGAPNLESLRSAHGVRSSPVTPTSRHRRSSKRPGALAQLVEHRLCKPGVRGSNPLGSTYSKAQVGRQVPTWALASHDRFFRFRARSLRLLSSALAVALKGRRRSGRPERAEWAPVTGRPRRPAHRAVPAGPTPTAHHRGAPPPTIGPSH